MINQIENIFLLKRLKVLESQVSVDTVDRFQWPGMLGCGKKL